MPRIARAAVVAATALSLAACASTTSAPPGTGAAAAGRELGRFVWYDLVTEDAAASRRFYSALLGWEFQDTERGGRPYVLVRAGGQYVAGIVALPPDTTRDLSQWVSYLSVPDVDAAVGSVTARGGRALVTPREVGSAGRAAVVADPQGAAIGLVRLARAIPAEPEQPTPGRFFWMEYLANDADSAVAFYSSLAGFESGVTQTEHGIAYHVLRRGRSRAGVLKSPFDGVRPVWLPYVLVDDPAALAARVASLGGRVILAPRPEIRRGSLAVVADPSGAALALQKYPF